MPIFKDPGRASGGGSAQYQALGEVRLQPAAIERTAGAASAGQVWITEASRPIRAVLSFINRCNPQPDADVLRTVQYRHDHRGKSRGIEHLLTAVHHGRGARDQLRNGRDLRHGDCLCRTIHGHHGRARYHYVWCQATYNYEPRLAAPVYEGGGPTSGPFNPDHTPVTP